MKELTKKVVILNNFSSPYVSQAIIIFKDYNPKLENKAISDAEQIVSKYLERTQKNGYPKKNTRSVSKKFKFLTLITFIAVFCLTVYILH